ncbi:MAG: hypothetical protein AB1410_11050, partial [Acidobacteriota bacterium]
LRNGMIYKWRKEFRKSKNNPFPGKGSRNTEKAKISQMERLIGREAMEIDFLKNALRHLKGEES